MSLGSYDWLKHAGHGKFSGWRRRHDRSPAVLNTMSMTSSSWFSPSVRQIGFHLQSKRFDEAWRTCGGCH